MYQLLLEIINLNLFNASIFSFPVFEIKNHLTYLGHHKDCGEVLTMKFREFKTDQMETVVDHGPITPWNMGKLHGGRGFENTLSVVLITSLYLMFERIFAADKTRAKSTVKREFFKSWL